MGIITKKPAPLQHSQDEYISFNGKIILTSEESDTYTKAISFINKQPIVGFDTETRPSFKKGISNKVSLIQFATNRHAILFRLIKHKIPAELIQIFENRNIIKAGVGINQDIKRLQELEPFIPQSFIEIQTLVKKTNLEVLSLKKLCEQLFQKKLSKRQQLSNWESVILTDAQVKYAATDAWVSYLIYIKLMDEYQP